MGRTGATVFDEVEVRLVSDPEEFISIKIALAFSALLKEQPVPQEISCDNESKTSKYAVGDIFFTTGFDGIYPEGQIVGRLHKVTENEGPNFKESLYIKLFFNPL